MMDTEKKPENDEDEDVNKEAKDSSDVSSCLVDCGPVSDVIANSSEISTSKRGFSESSNSDSAVLEEGGNKHASKRMKLAEVEPLRSAEQGVHGLETSQCSLSGVGVPSDGTGKGPSLNDCSDGDASLPTTFSPLCNFSTVDAVSLKTDTEATPAQETVSLDLEGEPPFPTKEIRVSCTVGDGDSVLKCNVCDHSFSSCFDLQKHAACHTQQSKEHACCHCGHQAESSAALQTHVTQTHGPQKVFSCDLCGFQCGEENLLNAHCLGKTHLRRQNLAARGGFVQILTKEPFPKKPCTIGTKNVRVKPRASKPIAKNGDSKGLRNVGRKFKDFRGSISKQSGSSSELLVEMIPSSNTLSEKVEIVEENVTSLGIAGNPENQSKKLGALATSEGLLDKLESTKTTPQTAHGVGLNPRPRPERHVLMLGDSFRRRTGTLTLKGQAKKRFNLLGMNKRGTAETQRMYMKHFRTQVKAGDAESTPEHLAASGSVCSLCPTSSETQGPKQDGGNTHVVCSFESPTVRAASDHKVCTCTDCGQIATSMTELDVHAQRCHTAEVKFHCQTCDFSSVSRRDLDEHFHTSQHQPTACVLSCQCCSFISSSDRSLSEHMKEKHSMGFLCTPCNLFFLSEKDMDEHKTTEKHARLLVQPKTSQPFNNDVILQTLPLSALELENTKESVSESGRATQEEAARPRLSHGNEGRHSSRPQFQCKKCFYKTRSSTVLTRHIKLRHGQDYHFLCKACNLYSLSKEGMEKHIKRSKHLENAKKNNIGLSFEECIERVCIGANDKKEEFTPASSGRTDGQLDGVQSQERSSLEKGRLTAKELSQPGGTAKDDELALTATPKRGRPKGTISRTCSHCGLLASSITNLTVHIRRKHSHQYSYLCKVCKYYTVTKGDMERHCTTKKHKGRVEIEANGKQSSAIIVGPEGGNHEACRGNTSSAVSDEHAGKSRESEPSVSGQPGEEHGSRAEAEAGRGFHRAEGEANSHPPDKKEQVSLEPEDLMRQGDACSQSDVMGPADNKCTHCEFHAHSPASLELHVKRKHTREFAFYCMACDYYAVTHREMTRHAATEKHKVKRHSYQHSSNADAGSAEMSPNIIAPEGQQPQSPEELPVISDRPLETLKSRNPADCSVLDESINLDMSKVLYAPDTVEVGAEEESSLSGDHSFCETSQQPLAKDKVSKPKEMASLNISSNYGSLCTFQDENSGSSALNYEIAKKNHHRVRDTGEPGTQCESEGGHAGDPAGEALGKPVGPGVPGGVPSVDSVLRMAAGQPHPASSGHDKAGDVQTSGDLQEVGGDPVLENKEVLMNSQHETEIILEEDGLASDSTVESNDIYGTIISIDEKGQAMYSLGRFDSSIIRIKSPEDGEPRDQSEEGLGAAGVRLSEPPLRDCAHGAKKRRPEGSPFAESTRIRCDDCGFLADGLSGLNVHIAMKHPTKEKHFHCLLCGKSFYTESNLHQHLASAGHLRNEQASVEELPEGGATFKCVKCTEPFDSEQSLFLHIKGQHEELLREVNKYIVEDTEQINREREENQGNVCKFCGKMCRSSNSMAFLAHVRTHTGSKPFKCKICHFATAQLGDARNHVKRHLGMREYKCHVCGVAFVMKKHLNTHLLGKHGVGTPKERKFTCHLCDRSFTEKWALNNHMKLHTGEKPFKCTWPTCHYSFLTASAMKDHYRTHTGEKSFLCDLCGFAGGTRHALTKHRRQHTGEKPFKCDECNFASTTQSHLTRHKRVHTGEKPYRCPWCDYRSNCAENIRKHILHTGKHEGVKMYNCPKCDYGTNVPVEFRNHLKEQHPDIENPDLAYLHAGIVSKSYECRLKGQGATFVETDSPFTAAALADESPVKDRPLRSRRPAAAEQVQQVVIIQGYDADFALDASVEETAAATLQTLALAGQVARVVHITEDGQVIAASPGGAHAGGGAPGPVLPEQLAEGAAQVVVVGGSVGSHGGAAPLSPGGGVMQPGAKPQALDLGDAGIPQPDAASALDALLCAVTELGGAAGSAGPDEKGGAGHRGVLVQLPGQEAPLAASQPDGPEIHVFQDPEESPASMEPVEVLTQVIRPSQERAQVAFRKVVQGVLQFAVCDSAVAGQLLKEGVTQVIVNEGGTVHMLAREGAQILMQEAEARGQHVALADPDREISQIIVTEELVQAMVQESAGSFPEGATHYIVTELPPGVQDETAMYSHTVIETADSPDTLQAGAALGAEAVVPSGTEQLTSMVIYTQESSPAATIIQSQRESHELQEA
ncbi:PREDICTED: zinc finger protein 407 isoform X1 [Hipposideros armiger]|uniref:Zinc finger protein 407 isoform X1 n=2 Tax=Hipposideros armiger TaxID=186990 RepID=A0A8B7RDU2_HIPAR|nr:PREDICTED: zinc finger protein 407 isoform X1 [Hipposideros armiger]XP_019498938.1 PREDICTED: zinc finger protein 407 isoform X1 [Hipposideros armiger]XP_019498939.1 PREDICTED: zinc finger protein 407 isoform X1 [Hipposideros armiger]XP_019498940.1 PREDICTED: zinc finger protein 407 isoform X1 [Hipposideros armiger]XP_019498941.1 PREDICTED: zinc finger protein 407 isoform X1 [Hipposideros armiger]XP_019498942.1 PREDICTED: zinc finger protein 407 isoform X1 [Hipposideros armiger]